MLVNRMYKCMIKIQLPKSSYISLNCKANASTFKPRFITTSSSWICSQTYLYTMNLNFKNLWLLSKRWVSILRAVVPITLPSSSIFTNGRTEFTLSLTLEKARVLSSNV